MANTITTDAGEAKYIQFEYKAFSLVLQPYRSTEKWFIAVEFMLQSNLYGNLDTAAYDNPIQAISAAKANIDNALNKR